MWMVAFIFAGEVLVYSNASSRQKMWVRALLLVLFALSSLLMHRHVGEDIFVDEGGAAIVLATLFGGAAVGLLATIVELASRAFIGGSSVMADAIGICADFVFSYAVLRIYMQNDPRKVRMRTILLAGLLVGVSEALSLLYIPPLATGFSLFTSYGPQLGFAQLLVVVLFGWLLMIQDNHQRTVRQLEENAKSLRDNLHQVVGVLSHAMSLRDPTTAGHEKNVAELVVLVGRRLGLSEERLEGLYLAALVHDIGQIELPTEILTRTRALRQEEFELIKQHAESGFNILKEVKFPWPIAEIVYQHHENVDGSGYPRGLKGDEILLESKIVRVSDSVEAMTSHRPFRKALSMAEAVAQLKSKSGTEFDPEVVDAFVRVLQQQDNNSEHHIKFK